MQFLPRVFSFLAQSINYLLKQTGVKQTYSWGGKPDYVCIGLSAFLRTSSTKMDALNSVRVLKTLRWFQNEILILILHMKTCRNLLTSVHTGSSQVHILLWNPAHLWQGWYVTKNIAFVVPCKFHLIFFTWIFNEKARRQLDSSCDHCSRHVTVFGKSLSCAINKHE
jgi:hypothetical protein